MTSEFIKFGSDDSFAVAVRWLDDTDSIASRPKDYGWSLGEIKLFAGGQEISASRLGRVRHGIRWYLSPMLHWIARNWAPMFHEEKFSWGEKVAMPGNMAIASAMQRLIGESEGKNATRYSLAKSWWDRHCVAAVDDGGLWPDICVRRFGDLIEMSWSNKIPTFAPPDFEFEFYSGQLRAEIDSVAKPMWDLLDWSLATADARASAASPDVALLKSEVARVRQMTSEALEKWYADSELITTSRAIEIDQLDDDFLFRSERNLQIPIVEKLSPAVAMFGAVSPTTTRSDVRELTETMLAARGGGENSVLARLVGNEDLQIGRSPAYQGYELAETLLERLPEVLPNSTPGTAQFIQRLTDRLSINVIEKSLETKTVRGVAIAGEDFRPTILLNLKHPFNRTQGGKRFTIAHELCHILFDRGRARRVTHASTNWTNPAIESRANAFAAMLLMPPDRISSVLANINLERATLPWVKAISTELGAGVRATIEHLHNAGEISFDEREILRDEYDAVTNVG